MSEANDILKQFGTLKKDLLPEPGGLYERQVLALADSIVYNMKNNLATAGKIASRRLSQSISFNDPIEIDEAGNVEIKFIAEDYAKYINEGVNGTVRNNNAPFWGKARPVGVSFKDSIRDWMRFRHIDSLTWTDKKTGKQVTKQLTTEADRDGAAFAIMRSIKRNGILPTGFIDKALDPKILIDFENELEKLWRLL